MQCYGNPERENDDYALPDVEVFQLTAEEVAQQDEDLLYDYMQRPEYRLATMNSKTRQAMLDAIVSENGITGGWFYWACFPGCLPDGPTSGPFDTPNEARAAAQEEFAEQAA